MSMLLLGAGTAGASGALSLTRAQQLYLPANTPAGTQVNVTDWEAAGLPGPLQQLSEQDDTIVGAFVNGAGTASVIGIYTGDGTNFELLGNSAVTAYETSAGNGEWQIRDQDGVGFAYIVSNPNPGRPLWHASNVWAAVSGDNPEPTVTPVTQNELNSGCIVSGAGSAGANGSYPPFSALNAEGRMGYGLVSDTNNGVYFGGGAWHVHETGGDAWKYNATSEAAFPAGLTFAVEFGDSPAPTIVISRPAGPANWTTI